MQNLIHEGKSLPYRAEFTMEGEAKATWDPANVWFGEQREVADYKKDDIWLSFFFYLFKESTIQY